MSLKVQGKAPDELSCEDDTLDRDIRDRLSLLAECNVLPDFGGCLELIHGKVVQKNSSTPPAYEYLDRMSSLLHVPTTESDSPRPLPVSMSELFDNLDRLDINAPDVADGDADEFGDDDFGGIDTAASSRYGDYDEDNFSD